MGGTNPYIDASNPEPAKKSFGVRFENQDLTIQVDPRKIPYGATGLAGSILDIALGHDIDIDHACGGVVACSTCHIYVKKGMEFCSPADEAEQDMLDNAPDVKPNSRLSCQCVPNGEGEVAIEIPSWNRNFAREGK